MSSCGGGRNGNIFIRQQALRLWHDYNWRLHIPFYKQKGAYADKTFDVSFGINSVEGTAGIEKAEPSAITLWKTNATVVNANDNTFLSKDIKYQLKFDNDNAVSSYRFKFDKTESAAPTGTETSCGGDCHFIFFFQHFPSEFDLHLFDANGNEIMPEATEPPTKGKTEKSPIVYANYRRMEAKLYLLVFLLHSVRCWVYLLYCHVVMLDQRRKTAWMDPIFSWY